MPPWAAYICPKKIWQSSVSRPRNLLVTPDAARFRPLLALEADRAREFYQSGDQLIPYISEDSQPALWVLVNIYRKPAGKNRRKPVRRLHGESEPDRDRKAPHSGEGFPETTDMKHNSVSPT